MNDAAKFEAASESMGDSRRDWGGRARSLRVVHMVPALFDPDDGILGGAERYVFELARHMAEETPTTLVSFGEKAKREQRGNLDVRVIGHPWYVRGQRGNPFSWRVIPEIRNADVVHCHQHHVLVSSFVALYCRMSGKKVYATDLGGGGWDVSAYVSTDRWYDAHLHISEYSRSLASPEARDRSKVILGGVDTAKFSPSIESGTGSTVLFVGRLLPHKGIDDLINAVPADTQLEIIGQPYDSAYYQHLQLLARGKQVLFRHDCDDRDIVEAYRRAACIVLPSVYRTMYGQESAVPELLGQTLLEGMACGIPGICTQVASLPEVVLDGVTGYVVPPNDSEALHMRIIRLLENREERKRMGEAARQRVLEKFTWSEVVRRCLAVYGS